MKNLIGRSAMIALLAAGACVAETDGDPGQVLDRGEGEDVELASITAAIIMPPSHLRCLRIDARGPNNASQSRQIPITAGQTSVEVQLNLVPGEWTFRAEALSAECTQSGPAAVTYRSAEHRVTLSLDDAHRVDLELYRERATTVGVGFEFDVADMVLTSGATYVLADDGLIYQSIGGLIAPLPQSTPNPGGIPGEFGLLYASSRHVCGVVPPTLPVPGPAPACTEPGGTRLATPLTPIVIREIASGDRFSCAVAQVGTVLTNTEVRCWSGEAALGLGTGAPGVMVSPIPQVDDPTGLAVGLRHACAIGADAGAVCWGDPSRGRLGGLPTSQQRFVDVGLRPVVQLALGGDFSAALLADGSVWTWGANDHGQLGLGHHEDAVEPQAVLELPEVVQIAAGLGSLCAVTADGALYCWGSNSDGQVGMGRTGGVSSPVRILDSGVARVFGGPEARHHCAELTDGSVSCWGNNEAGALNDGSAVDRYEPVPTSW
jgi:hypothetical protein